MRSMSMLICWAASVPWGAFLVTDHPLAELQSTAKRAIACLRQLLGEHHIGAPVLEARIIP